MKNVNLSFKAAGTTAAHRLSLVPTSEMGQVALQNKTMREEKGNQYYWTKAICQNFYLSHANTGTLRKTKHPSRQLLLAP